MTWADKIYSDDWRAWKDPEVPTWFNPAVALLERHAGTAIDAKPALVQGADTISYSHLRALVESSACGLADLGLQPDQRILLFGTDSIEYVAVWLGAVRAGVVPAVVSDLYKTRDLLYFLMDTGARALFI